MPRATVNGVELHYEVHGERGDPLVLVHGYTRDITDWRHQLPEFSRTHRVLIMDLRGHGRSQAPADRARYTITDMADDVEALVEHVGFERYHLLGHSMGGAVVQEIDLRSPQRIASLTLHDTNHTFGGTRIPIVARYYEQRLALAEAKGMAAVAALSWPLPLPPHQTPERSAEEEARLAAMSADGFVGAWQGMQAWAGTKDRAQNIAAPTLVIYGELESAGMAKASRWLAATIPDATLVAIPEAGHSPQFERPELFNLALRAHLDRSTPLVGANVASASG